MRRIKFTGGSPQILLLPNDEEKRLIPGKIYDDLPDKVCDDLKGRRFFEEVKPTPTPSTGKSRGGK